MRRFARGLVASLESEQIAAAAASGTPAEAVVAPVAPIVDHSDTVETGLLDIAEGEAEAAQVDEQTDEAVEVATALEGIAECLKSAAGNGGLSRDGAAAVNVAVGHLYKRVGINQAKRSMPALESYGSVSSRVTATTLAVEDIKEKAKQIWAAIVEAIKKSILWLTEHWQLFYGTAEKLKKRGEEMAATAEKTTGEAKEKELDKSALVAALHVAGKVDGTIGHIEGLSKVADLVFGQVSKRVEAFSKAVEAKTVGDILAPLVDMDASALNDSMKLVDNPEAEGLRKPAEGVIVMRSPELPGGKAFFSEAKVPGKDTKPEDAVSQICSSAKAYVADYSSKTKPAEGAKLPVLTPADAAKLAKAVVAMAGSIEKFQAEAKKIGEEKKKLVAKAEELAKAEGNTSEQAEGNDAPVTKSLREMMTALGRVVDTPIAGASVYLLNTGKRALDYVGLSLDAYSGKAVAAAAEPKKDEGGAAPVAA